jgi:hypothetical protein
VPALRNRRGSDRNSLACLFVEEIIAMNVQDT